MKRWWFGGPSSGARLTPAMSTAATTTKPRTQYGSPGAGVKGGTVHGATDDVGMHSVEDICEPHDLHATILHLFGLDHERLTYRFGGRDVSLTDVHGRVIEAVLS